jgi:anti-sigma-K factor RskA
MKDHQEILDTIPAYALGILDPEEAEQLSAHIASCAECQAELNAQQETVGYLGYAAPDHTPPSGLKDQIMDHIQPSGQDVPESTVPWWRQLFGRRPALSLAAVGLIVLLAVGNILLWNQVQALRTLSFDVISLSSTTSTPSAKGLIIVSADGRYGTLVASDMQPLDETQQYQLWLIKDGERTSGGVFSVSGSGYTAFQVYSKEPLSSFDAFGITVEPYGGSPAPTGEKVLGSET